jgi:ferric-dicitrate binding protein FerR (iron transport regulator)
MDNAMHIADLIVKEIKGIISTDEKVVLDQWIKESPMNLSTYNRARDSKHQLDKLEVYKLFRKEEVWNKLEGELFDTKTRELFPNRMFRYAAAIILPLLILGGAAYIFLFNPVSDTLAEIDSEIQPGDQKAILILSDGNTLELTPETFQSAIQEGDAIIRNEESLLSYSAASSAASPAGDIYNELQTPRGGTYSLKLADGTAVWLNAGSSLRFPVAFTESTRQVYLEGEAYFEVSHNGKPFMVNAENMDIEVLGTSFNVLAYLDETQMKTTLVEGKVRITYPGAEGSTSIQRELAPRQQAVIDLSSGQISLADVNASHYTSWMRGKIEFNDESLDVVLLRLSRWYDFDYTFESAEARDFHFTARFNKDEQISTILEMLEMTTHVRFEYRKNQIVVLSGKE